MDPNAEIAEIAGLARLVRRERALPDGARLRPITPGELALFAKTGHARCRGGGRIVFRAVGDKPGGPSERTGICPCAARKVWQAQLDGRLADDEGVLCVVERAEVTPP